jgi:hypothetical protein
MKLTKSRLQKIIHNKNGNQTRKKYKAQIKLLKHTNTIRNYSSLKKPFNLHNKTIKNYGDKG